MQIKNKINQALAWISKNRWLFSVVLMVSLFAISAETNQATNFQNSLAGAGDEAKAATIAAMKRWMWLVGFLPLGVAGIITLKVKDYLEQKDEQGGGQSEPKWSRQLKLIITFIASVIICYVVLGIFAKVFGGADFGQLLQKIDAIEFYNNVKKIIFFLIK